MTVVALDASGMQASVCIVQKGQVTYQQKLEEGLTHSQTLLPLLQNAMQKAGVSPAQVGLYAISAGPGSFTGLRIGLALVKGLALPYNTPVVPVSTLQAMAIAAGVQGVVLPAINARRQEIYWGLYTCEDGLCTPLRADAVGPAQALKNDDILMKLQCGGLFLVGDGAQLCYNQFGCMQQAQITPLAHSIAYGVALAGYKGWQAGNAISAEKTRPVYLRLSQAERERKERKEKQSLPEEAL